MSRRKRKSVRRSSCARFPKSSPRRRRGSKRAMPRGMRRIRDLHDAGGALKISPETLSVTSDSRKHVSHPQFGCLSNFSCAPLFALCVFCLLCVYSSGCAARKPIADRRQPPPVEPSSTPAETADAAKRSTDVPDASATPPAVASVPKKNKPAPVPAPSGYTEEGNASWYGVPEGAGTGAGLFFLGTDATAGGVAEASGISVERLAASAVSAGVEDGWTGGGWRRSEERR